MALSCSAAACEVARAFWSLQNLVWHTCWIAPAGVLTANPRQERKSSVPVSAAKALKCEMDTTMSGTKGSPVTEAVPFRVEEPAKSTTLASQSKKYRALMIRSSSRSAHVMRDPPFCHEDHAASPAKALEVDCGIWITVAVSWRVCASALPEFAASSWETPYARWVVPSVIPRPYRELASGELVLVQPLVWYSAATGWRSEYGPDDATMS